MIVVFEQLERLRFATKELALLCDLGLKHNLESSVGKTWIKNNLIRVS